MRPRARAHNSQGTNSQSDDGRQRLRPGLLPLPSSLLKRPEQEDGRPARASSSRSRRSKTRERMRTGRRHTRILTSMCCLWQRSRETPLLLQPSTLVPLGLFSRAASHGTRNEAGYKKQPARSALAAAMSDRALGMRSAFWRLGGALPVGSPCLLVFGSGSGRGLSFGRPPLLVSAPGGMARGGGAGRATTTVSGARGRQTHTHTCVSM